MDLEPILKQLRKDMKETGRGAFRPDEVADLVIAAAYTVRKADERRDATAHPPYTSECLNEANGCSCRRKGVASCCMHGSEKP